MAVKTIKASGGDYTGLSAWEAALPATTSAVEGAECYDFDLSDNFAVSGVTTSAANYLHIYTPASERHDGRSRTVSGSGFRIKDTTGAGTFRLGTTGHVRLDGLEIEQTGANSAMLLMNGLDAGNDIRVENCIIHDAQTGTAYTILAIASGLNLAFRNNIVYGNCRSWDTRGAASVLCENSTFWRHQAQLGLVSDAELTCKNTYSGHTGGAADDFWSGGSPSGNNNASSDTSATARFTSSVNSVAGSAVFVSVTAGAEDFALAAGANALVDAGATLASVTTDAKGTARPQGAAYDIGALERAAAGGGAATDVNCAIGALAASGLAASIALTTAIDATVGGVEATGLSASVSIGTVVDAVAGYAAAQGLSASVSISTVVACGTGALSATGLAAALDNGTSVSAGIGAAAIAGLPATILTQTTIECSTGALDARGLVAQVGIATEIDCQPGGLMIAGLPAGVAISVTIQASVGSLVLTGQAASISVVTTTNLISNALRTLLVPLRARRISVPVRQRQFIVRNEMIYQADSKRSDESPVFSLNIRKELALTGDAISSVTAEIEVATGSDPAVGSMLVGSATHIGSIISARVGGGVSGNKYNLKFTVTTPQQVLTYVVSIPVDDEGAFV
jgi:hypothetical protein